MRPLFSIVACLISLALPAGAQSLKVAVTTSFHNSGLSDVLLPVIKEDTGLVVQLLVVGTGQALKLGASGDVDAILVHSRAAEDAFLAQGHGLHRREIMYNDFVVIGPKDDPAQINKSSDMNEVMNALHVEKPFTVSRGDESGTHKKELSLWQNAGLNPEAFGRWYKEVGAGMGAALNTAAGLDAYILSDRASWLNFGNKAGLALLFSGDPVLFNQYAYIPVNPDKHAAIKAKEAMQLEAWLTSDTAKELIDGYTIDNEKLFTFNAQ